MTDEELLALDEWGDRIASLDVATRVEILDWLARLAGDRRLANADHDFAQAQEAAIRRAIRRTGAGDRKSSKSRKK